METINLNRSTALLVSILSIGGCNHEPELVGKQLVTEEAYAAAREYLSSNKSKFILNDSVTPNWFGDNGDFWYVRNPTSESKQFVRVESSTGEKSPAFDHEKIAAEIFRLTEEKTDAGRLPFDTFQYTADDEISFVAHAGHFVCGNDECKAGDPPEPKIRPGETASPDGQWAVYFKEENLWLRSLDGDADFALTSDGVADYAYGVSTGTDLSPISRKRMGMVDSPIVSFSPDGKYLLTQKIDQRDVGELHLVHQTPADSYRPQLYSARYAMALDEHKPRARFVVINLQTFEQVVIDYPEINLNFIPHLHPLAPEAFWLPKGDAFVFVHRFENGTGYSINHVDIVSGEVATIVERRAVRTAFPGMSVAMVAQVKLVGDSGVVWYSDEGGWGHLYLSKFSGETRKLTDGKWNVVEILWVDETSRFVYFTRTLAEDEGNPYHRRLSRVALDGSGLVDLTSEPGVHQISMAHVSPDRRYIIDNVSSSTNPGKSYLRRIDGQSIALLESADTSALDPRAFTSVEGFEVIAADGKTRIWGRLIKPLDFDPQKTYPVVDFIYPGPQINRISHAFSGRQSCGLFDDLQDPFAMAQLGFVTLCVDGRGTPGRSAEFNYKSEKSLLGKAGFLEDHIEAIRQLADTRPWMNLDAVGITGHSGGGYASIHALLLHPDFFKVAVSSAGNHEQRSYLPVWGESYLGEDDGENYRLASNPDLAGQLKGNLLLIFGAMDDNVHPTQTYQLINELIKADKTFDVVILPDSAHNYRLFDPGEAAYSTRRTWDYFVEHLMVATPPGNE